MKYIKGLYANRPHPKAPEYVIASLSVKPVDLIDSLQMFPPDEYLYLDVKRGKEKDKNGNEKFYVQINDYKRATKTEVKTVDGMPVIDIDENNINPEDLPF